MRFILTSTLLLTGFCLFGQYITINAPGQPATVTVNAPGKPSSVVINPPASTALLKIQQYEHGTSYNAWGTGIAHQVAGQWVRDYFYSSTTHHLGKASSRRLRVTESGTFIEDVELFSDPLISRRDFGGGITSNGTIIVFYVEAEYDAEGDFIGQTGMGFYRSTDGFETFTDHPGSMPLGDNTAFANYGNLLEHPVTGRLYHTAYGTAIAGRMITSYSDDDGLTWTFLSKTGSATQYSEGTMLFLSGTTNANAVLGYFVRNDVGVLGYFHSTDGGATFTFLETVAWSSSKAVAPSSFKRADNGNHVLIYTDRSSFNYTIRAFELDGAILAAGGAGATTNALIKSKTLYESFINSHPFESSNLPGNFGYATPAFYGSDAARWTVFLYDQSPKQQEPWSTGEDDVQCDMIMIPFENEVRVKARSTTNKTFSNDATTQLIMEDKAMDSHGAWENGEFTAPETGTYDISINLPVTNTNGGTKTLSVTKNDVEVYTYQETAGSISASGKIYGNFQVAMDAGDVLKFFINVTGASGSVTVNCATTPTGGLFHTVDIFKATVKNLSLKVSPSAQLFSNGVATKVQGTIDIDTHNAWVDNEFVVPYTAWYKIRFRQLLPNAGGGRRIFTVWNYEVGQADQETRRKRLFNLEDKAGAGTNKDMDMTFYYRLNRGETVKFWLTVSGTSLTNVDGEYYSIEITEQ